MDTLPTGRESRLHGPWQHGMWNVRTDHRMANTIYGDSNSNVGNVSNSYNTTINVGIEEELLLRIREWLSPLQPHKRHQNVRNCRLDGIGEWVLRRSEFELWCGSQDGSANPTLLCFGAQGVGKTYIRSDALQEPGIMLTSNKISSLVIDTLRKRARGQNNAVVFLYCDYQTQKDQTPANMIGSLVRQTDLRAPKIQSEIKSAFDESKNEDCNGLQLPEMVKLFVNVIASCEVVYLCVDAVDEVLPQHRSEFLRALGQIVQEAPNVRLFVTGRPYIRIELDKHLTRGAYAIHIVADQGDITRYLSRKMDDDDQGPNLMTEDLKNHIMKTMLEKASEM